VFRLLPRDENFFDLFEQQAGHIVSASRVLEELTLDYPPPRPRCSRSATSSSTPATRSPTRWSGGSTPPFVTPIDREGIYALASRLDDVLDLIDAVADRRPS
jgi:hypothetical protein